MKTLDIFRTRKNRWDIYAGKPPESLEKPEAWHAWRLKGIGGSDANMLMNAVPEHWGNRLELWKIKTGKAKPRPATPAMKRGITLQSRALKVYQDMTGIEMLPDEQSIHPDYSFIRCNYDGLNLEKKIAAEVKCPGWQDHREALKGRIPDKYIWQCVHILLANPTLDCVDYFSFDGKKGARVPFERNKKMEQILLSEEIPFWECVVKDIPPEENMKNEDGKENQIIVELLQEILFELRHLKTQEPSLGKCDQCGSELSAGKEGRPPYCVPCYIERKERREAGRRSYRRY